MLFDNQKIKEIITYIYRLEKCRTAYNDDSRQKQSIVFYNMKGLQ